MLLPKDAWIELLKKTGFVDLKYIYQNDAGIFLVKVFDSDNLIPLLNYPELQNPRIVVFLTGAEELLTA